LEKIKEIEFNDVLKEHEKIIYRLINKYQIRDGEKEFYQEGVIALWKAHESYEPAKGKFSTYAYFLIEKSLLSLIRKTVNQREVDEAILVGTTETFTTLSAEDLVLDPYLMEQIEQSLTANQMKWLTYYGVHGLKVKEIAEKEDVSVDAVKNWGRVARGKIKKLLEDC
jgi:RNA polymerase sigma factor (sigma-70 family)